MPFCSVIGPAVGPNQTNRKITLFVAVGVGIGFLFFTGPYWPTNDWRHEGIEAFGLALIIACIFGRTWCSIYIGGRKNHELVSDGPYSVSRNPLYFFSIVGAIGVGAQVGSILVALLCGFITWAVFLRTVLREEAALSQAFGDDYQAYLNTVPRFVPKRSLWHDRSTVEVRPRVIVMTFADALVFFASVPLTQAFEYLREAEIVPVLLALP